MSELFILFKERVEEDEIEKAIEAINKGLKKGNLKNPGFAQLTLGQALFELQRFNEAT